MSALRITPECECMLEEGLYLIALLLSGLSNRASEIVSASMCDKNIGHEFSDFFSISLDSWVKRRTCRCFVGSHRLSGKPDERINSAICFLNEKVGQIVLGVEMRELICSERAQVVSQLSSEVECDFARIKVIGFFYEPADFVLVRDVWILIGFMAHLLCVYCVSVGVSTFVTHGLSREHLPCSLAGLEYVVLIG